MSFDRSLLDFGVMPIGVAPPPLTLTLRNDGNEATQPHMTLPPDFTVLWSQPSVEPGQAITATVAFSASTLGTFTGAATVATDNLCGIGPTVTLRAVNADGIVGVSPGVADLGLVGCGTKNPLPGVVTVFNASKQAFDVSASIVGAGLFTVTPAKATVPAESKVELTVSLPAVPQTAPIVKGYFAETLHVVTTAPKDSAHDVPLVASPAGGIVVLTSGALVDFAHRAAVGGSSTKGLGLQNFGNLPVTITGAVATPFSTTSPLMLTPGATGALVVQHDPRFDDVGDDTLESVVLTTAEPVCAPLPGNLQAAVRTYELASHASVGNSEVPNDRHSCAVGGSGHVYCWGGNGKGQLGTNGGPAGPRARLVATLTNVARVDANHEVTCAVTVSGAVWCWGRGAGGVLGNGSTFNSPVPLQVQGITDAVKVVVAMNHVCALRNSGGVMCWGAREFVGDGSVSPSGITPPVAALVADAVDIDTEYLMTCAAKKTGAVVCWGWDMDTEFAGSGVNFTTTPLVIAGASGAVEVAVWGTGGCYLSASGPSCWGSHPDGSFSIGPKLEEGPLTGLSASYLNRCAIKGGNQVFCYGQNRSGVLGTGGEQSWVGVVRSGTAVWLSLDNTLATDSGTLWIWGTPWGSNMIVTPQPVPGFDP